MPYIVTITPRPTRPSRKMRIGNPEVVRGVQNVLCEGEYKTKSRLIALKVSDALTDAGYKGVSITEVEGKNRW